MNKLRKILSILLIVLMFASIAACGSNDTGDSTSTSGSANEAGSESDGGTDAAEESDYVVRTVGTTSLGCFLVGSAVTANGAACTAVFDSLWTLDGSTGEVTSNTLENWYYEDDCTLVCTLKDGIYFSNGEKATSEDVLFSITNYIERGAPIGDMYGALNVEESYCEDEFTCVFKFDEPWGPGIYNWASYLFCKSWCEEVGWDSTDWYDCPVGSGPYEVGEFVTDDHFTLILRDDYWDDSADFTVGEWEFLYYGDASTMAIEFEQGKLDIVSGLTTTDFDRYLADDSIDVGTLLVQMNDVLFLTFGFENTDVFDDVAVREAIAKGVDWAAIGDMAYSSVQTVATSILPSTSPYYLDVGTYEYDPDAAKQVLADAGYSDGDIVINITAIDSTMYKSVCEGFQYYANQLGITVNLEFADTATAMVAWLTPGGTDMGIQSNPTGDISGEPHSCLMQMAMTGAFLATHVLDDEYQALYTEAMATVDTDERIELFHELQQYVHDNYLIMPICEYYTVYGLNPSVYTEEEMDNAVVAGTKMYLTALS
ncbi:MAG: ABC transporter substrate-binding protein [Oscillospiraceae bacterium]|nr:ABC transporter substrate-binding protein [Oscillospiraceae bacterium]